MLPPTLSKADLHLLHVFSAVVEARGFSAAQIKLNVAASTISRQMSDLELRLGIKLCDRGRAGFRLTQDGERVYRYAQRLFASVKEFTEAIDGTRDRLVGNLSVAVIDNWVFNDQSQFSIALRKFIDDAPDVMIELSCLAPDDIEMAVQDGQASLGIGVFHRHKPGLIYDSIGFETIGLYCAKDHPLFGVKDKSRMMELMESSRYAKRAYLRERDIAPISRGLMTNAYAHQIEGIAYLILTGKYIGYLPEQLADVWIRAGSMRSIGDGQFDQPSELKIVKKRGADQNMVSRTFENYVRKGQDGNVTLTGW